MSLSSECVDKWSPDKGWVQAFSSNDAVEAALSRDGAGPLVLWATVAGDTNEIAIEATVAPDPKVLGWLQAASRGCSILAVVVPGLELPDGYVIAHYEWECVDSHRRIRVALKLQRLVLAGAAP